MRSISVSKATRAFGATLEAAQREPLIIRKRNRNLAVLLSVTEYKKLRSMAISSFERLCDDIAAQAAARGLTDEMFESLILNSDEPEAF